MASTLAAPRSPAPATHPNRKFNVEKWGWIYMRASGVLLIVLIFGHLFVNLVAGEGVKQIDFAFIAGKYATPFWKIWDCAMLWLALIHGTNGMRTITNDYVVNPAANRLVKGALVVSAALLIVLGTMVIFTFDPCPVNGTAENLPAFCSSVAR